MATGSPLFNLMAEMASNPDLLDAFRNNPAMVMENYHLPEEQRLLLLAAMNSNRQIDVMKVIADEAYTAYNIHHPDATLMP